ncbi:MAG: histidine phosphatase family protein [Bacteroidota bacterium]
MIFYLIRHASAERVGGAVSTDADRPLSAQGEREARLAGRLMRRLDPSLGAVLTSPLRRAVQTARMVAEAMPRPVPVRESGNLSPGFKPALLLQEVQALGPGFSAALVGHQPDLGLLLTLLAGEGDAVHAAFPPGTVAALALEGEGTGLRGELRWLLTPPAAGALLSSEEGEGS